MLRWTSTRDLLGVSSNEVYLAKNRVQPWYEEASQQILEDARKGCRSNRLLGQGKILQRCHDNGVADAAFPDEAR